MAERDPQYATSKLGYYEGLPILSQKMIINKTGDGLSAAVEVAPREIDPDSQHIVSVRLQHRKTRYDNVYSELEDKKLLGVIQVHIFDAIDVGFDDRSTKGLDELSKKIADERDKREAQKAGQRRLPYAEAEGLGDDVSSDEPREDEEEIAAQIDRDLAHLDGNDDNVREIRPGVADDEGASEGDDPEGPNAD